MIKNVILGSLTLEFDGKIEALNIKTREVIFLDMFEGKKNMFNIKNTEPYIKGIGYTNFGVKELEISGSWSDQITLKYKDEAPEVVWKQPQPI